MSEPTKLDELHADMALVSHGLWPVERKVAKVLREYGRKVQELASGMEGEQAIIALSAMSVGVRMMSTALAGAAPAPQNLPPVCKQAVALMFDIIQKMESLPNGVQSDEDHHTAVRAAIREFKVDMAKRWFELVTKEEPNA